VGSRALAVCRGAEPLLAEPVADVGAGLQLLVDWLTNAPPKQRLRVWMSGGLCRPYRLAPVAGVRSEAELRRVAPAIASRQSGLEGVCRVWMDGGKPGETRTCVVVQARTVDGVLRAVPNVGGHRVLSIRPWWAEVLRSVLERAPQSSSVATHDCDSLTLLGGLGAGFDVATTLTPVVGRDAADAALARMLLSADAGHGAPVVARLVLEGARSSEHATGVALTPLVEFAK
jgi:hypothetical protein